MKFFIPNSVIDRYSFRARGKLLLENMANNHGYINDYQLIKNTNELYIIGKEFDHDVIQHCNENKINYVMDISDFKFYKNSMLELYKKATENCKAIVTTCDYLADEIKKIFDKPSIVIEDPTERKQIKPNKKIFTKHDNIKIVIYGARKNIRPINFENLKEQLFKVHQNIQLKIITNKTIEDPIEWIDWSFELQEKLVQESDFILLPIAYTEKKKAFLKSKGNNRPIDGIQQGKFVITNDTIPSYVDLNNFIWTGDIAEGLKYAIDNPNEVVQKITLGQQHINKYYTPSRIVKKWLDLESKILNETSL